MNTEQDLGDICKVEYRLHMRQTMTLRLRLIRKEQIWILWLQFSLTVAAAVMHLFSSTLLPFSPQVSSD